MVVRNDISGDLLRLVEDVHYNDANQKHYISGSFEVSKTRSVIYWLGLVMRHLVALLNMGKNRKKRNL